MASAPSTRSGPDRSGTQPAPGARTTPSTRPASSTRTTPGARPTPSARTTPGARTTPSARTTPDAQPTSARTRSAARTQPASAHLLEHRLIVVTGKGGVGKTTVSAALAVVAAERGLRTIVVELGDQRRLPGLFAEAPVGDPGQSNDTDGAVETQLAQHLWSVTIDQDQAILEWLQSLGGRIPGRVLAGSGTFQYFAAAAPGAQELVSMVKVWELARGERWRKRSRRYDLVILDAPATGHALGLLHAPFTFGAIARVGPIFGQAEHIRELLQDPAQTAYLGVTHPTEMAVAETLDLRAGLRSRIGRDLDAVVVNAVLPRRFDAGELALLDRLDAGQTDAAGLDAGGVGRDAGDVAGNTGDVAGNTGGVAGNTGGVGRDAGDVAGNAGGVAGDMDEIGTDGTRTTHETRAVIHSARAAAQSMHTRARIQHNHIARLRRAGMPVHTLPFLFTPELGLRAIESIGRRLSGWVQ